GPQKALRFIVAADVYSDYLAQVVDGVCLAADCPGQYRQRHDLVPAPDHREPRCGATDANHVASIVHSQRIADAAREALQNRELAFAPQERWSVTVTEPSAEDFIAIVVTFRDRQRRE